MSVQYKKTYKNNVNQKKLQYNIDKKKQDKRRKQGRKEKTFQNEIYSEIKTSTHNRKNTNAITDYDYNWRIYLIGYWDNKSYQSGRWLQKMIPSI